jgi:DNA-binding transcriptional ArsR family regulator
MTRSEPGARRRARSGPAPMPRQLVAQVADRFKALAEPSRLELLQALRDGSASVSELVARTGLSQANVSKHLAVLLAAGFVSRRRQGLFVHYELADRDVLRLCEIMCGRLGRELDRRRQAVGSARRRVR